MSAETITNAVAKRDTGPAAMVKQYGSDFQAVLPSHIKPEQWIRLAQGALKKGRKQGGRFELEIAAGNNPGVFLAALLDAARLGLEPGTEQFYLTPRKVKGQLEILGIVGYQGLIELMYRAGAISSVVAECVYEHDTFRFRPGQDEIPTHEIDWDADDRGNLRLVYAFARMKDGATSKVVVLNRAAIQRIKATSQGADSQYSPWTTSEPAMWLKSAVRQLAKWVPTSAEYMREQLRAVRDVAAEPAGMDTPRVPGELAVQDVSHLPVDAVLDAELVGDRSDEVTELEGGQ
ncbi:recombinase RecT [Pseudonocardia sp. KRD-184]|uniref:Recombinase RecT n=1 Tax=Pseudonocardia oceani TaxID=2792013 RepID=A0ABS6UH34_9PSEU|nr:recombinase RecT [Pseudonocardia oceani]MBW0088269.1 recombinase RecT [Pseudonocardia oceani]MBW0095051.1 recombinase RecT [Pseudonocardia oceani]MBW0121096.1 recombinase RecT [Pseudonocardia oceani]MBW0131218.1 recombinase RecT [Pseudonocardia oceani]MBW0132615.1 recombinase RecT [Pseudonocardia oceani]